MASPPPSSPPAPHSPPPPQKHQRTGGSKGSSSMSSRKSVDKTLPGIPGLPSGAASPSIVSTPSPAILYPPIPVPASGAIPGPPSSKTVQYPARPPNQLPPPVPTPPATAPPSAAPSRLTSLSSTNSKYAPSPLGTTPGTASTTRQPSSSSTGQSSGDEGSPDGPDKLRKRKKPSKKKSNSDDMGAPPASKPVRYPSMVLSRLVREEAESAANSNWMGVPPQRSSTVPANLGTNRGSMILYRLADEEDRYWPTEGQLSRPASNHSLAPPPNGRFTANRLSVSPSFDSKYPSFPVTGEGSPNSPPLALSGYATPPGSRPNSAYRNSSGTPPPGSTPLSQGVFLPYEYDPTEDETGPNDSVDDLHHVVLELGSDGKYKFPKERMADFNIRGVINVICLTIVILGVVATFLAYPVVDSVQRTEAYEAAQQGAVIVNPVGPKDGTTTDATTTDDSILTPTDPFSTSPTRTRPLSTADPTPTTDGNGDPIQTDTGLPVPTPTPTLTPGTTPIDPNTVLPGDTLLPGDTVDPGTLRKRIAQPTLPVIAARRMLQARS